MGIEEGHAGGCESVKVGGDGPEGIILAIVIQQGSQVVDRNEEDVVTTGSMDAGTPRKGSALQNGNGDGFIFLVRAVHHFNDHRIG